MKEALAITAYTQKIGLGAEMKVRASIFVHFLIESFVFQNPLLRVYADRYEFVFFGEDLAKKKFNPVISRIE